MKIIYKYPLPRVSSRNSFMFPGKASIKHLAYQYGSPTVWVEVEPDGKGATVIDIHCFGTGFDIPDHFEYVGTLIDGGGYVWHYYAENF